MYGPFISHARNQINAAKKELDRSGSISAHTERELQYIADNSSFSGPTITKIKKEVREIIAKKNPATRIPVGKRIKVNYIIVNRNGTVTASVPVHRAPAKSKRKARR